MSNKTKQKWTILGVYTLGSMWNGFTFSNFGGNVEVVTDAYNISVHQLNFIYSVIFITVGFSFVPIMLYAERYNWIVVNVGTFSGCLATWIRWWSLDIGSYPLVVLSSVLIGFQSAVVCGTFVFIAERWFEPSSRALATQLTLQSNYAGWAISAAVVPYMGGSKSSLRRLFFIQALNMTIALVAIFMFYRSPPRAKLSCSDKASLSDNTIASSTSTDAEREVLSVLHQTNKNIKITETDTEEKEDYNRFLNIPSEGSVINVSETIELLKDRPRQPFRLLFRNKQFNVLLVSLALMTGIGFTIPALQQEQLSSLHFSEITIGWSSFLFISSGVLFGVVLGHYLKTWQQCGEILPTLFMINSISLSFMCALQYGSKHLFTLNQTFLFVITLVCMFFSGGSSLSVLGIGMRVVVHITYPVSDIYTSSVIEFGVQCVSSLLPMVTIGEYGYVALAGVSWMATLLFAVGFETTQQHHTPLAGSEI